MRDHTEDRASEWEAINTVAGRLEVSAETLCADGPIPVASDTRGLHTHCSPAHRLARLDSGDCFEQDRPATASTTGFRRLLPEGLGERERGSQCV